MKENVEIKMVYPEQFQQISEGLFKRVFERERRRDIERIDFACIFYYKNQPIGYATCYENSRDVLTLQFGGAFPEFRNSRLVYVTFNKLIQKLLEKYSFLRTRVDSENIPMLKLAFKCGWRIIGTVISPNKTSLLVELANSREKTVKAYLDSGNQLRKEGKIPQAVEKYSQALRLSPEFVPALTQLADIYTKLAAIYENRKDFDRANTCHQEVVQLLPDNSLTQAGLAEAMMKQGNTQGAVVAYQKAIALQPESPARVYQGLANALAKNGQVERVLAAYQEIIKLQSVIELNQDLAEVVHSRFEPLIIELSIRQGQLDEAITFFQEALENQPDNPWYHYHLARALAIHGQLDEAITCYQNAIQIQPEFYQAHAQLGTLLLQKGDPSGALQCGLKIFQIEPSGEAPTAVGALRRELLTLPLSLDWEASNQAFPNGLWEQTYKVFQDAIERTERMEQPDSSRLISLCALMGRFLRQQGKLSEAIAYYQKAIYHNLQRAKPEFVSQYWDMGKQQPPNFLVIGFMKCGTTALYNYLVQHPQILPSVTKELQYLAQLVPKLENINENRDWHLLNSDRDFYLAHFPPRPEGDIFLTGEASLSNSFPGVEKIVFNFFPNVKLIAILRNPVKRAISQYFHWLKEGWEHRTLEEVIDTELEVLEGMTEPDKVIEEMAKNRGSLFYRGNYLIHGLYVYFLEKWMNLFPREQFLILSSEDLSKDPVWVMKKAFEFLSLPVHVPVQPISRNAGCYPQIDEDVLSRLSNFYRPHNQRLEEYLGKKFNWE